MKMKEKYRDEIVNYEDGIFCADFLKKIVLPFYDKECENLTCAQCGMLCRLWLDEEYIEPEETFECDELVEVSNNGNRWYKSYYAEYKDGKHYCWTSGMTSKSVPNKNWLSHYNYIRKCEQ